MTDLTQSSPAATGAFCRRRPPLDLNRLPAPVHEIMRAYYLHYPATVLLPHAFLPEDLQIPQADERLVRASHTLLRATGPTEIRSRCSWTRKTCVHMGLLDALVTDRAPQFYYYVAGSFVVSELLGFGEWKTIDLCTQPFPVRSAGEGFRIAAGKGAYPVKVMAVNHMESFIESADLHLTSCAILCCNLADGTRGFELYMTKNCAVAYKMRAVHSCALHPALANGPDVRKQMLEYVRHGATGMRRVPSFLACEHDEQATRKMTQVRNDARSLLFATRFVGASCTSTQAQWKLEVRDGSMFGIVFCFAGDVDCTVPACMPIVCYPCSPESKGSLQRLPEGSHWLLELVTRKPLWLVGTRGGGRVHATSLLPDWLVKRMHLTRSQVDWELRQRFALQLRGGDSGFIDFPCRLPVRLLRVMTDWDEDKATWCFLFDAPWQESLKSIMFCRDTGRMTETCDHGFRHDYALKAYPWN